MSNGCLEDIYRVYEGPYSASSWIYHLSLTKGMASNDLKFGNSLCVSGDFLESVLRVA